MKYKLSDIQERVKLHTDGALLVLAGAGSGKTRVLTERIKTLLETGTYHILALTFTNKAAEEMKSRLEDVTDIQDRAFIGTIHSFCLEIINKQGYAIGLKEVPHFFDKEEDRKSILIDVFDSNIELKNIYLNKVDKERRNFIYEILDYISNKKKNLIEAIPNNPDINGLIYWEYQELLKKQNAIDFDDVIFLAYRILADRPSIAKIYRRLYKYISIDEAQDLNFAQYEFIKLLCNGEHKNVLMVGDINQSLFHFNGSDIKYMKDLFKKDFGADTIELKTNYRSSKAVLKIANKIKPDSTTIDPETPEGLFELKSFETDKDEANWVIDKIEELLSKKNEFEEIEGAITLDKIAVLARNKFLFQSIDFELKKRNNEGKKLDYFFKKGTDITDLGSELMILFDLGLSILSNNQDQLHYSKIQSILGFSKIDLLNNESGLENLKKISAVIDNEESQVNYNLLIDAWTLIDKGINNFSTALNNLEKSIKTIYEEKEDAVKEDAVIELDKIFFDINSFRDLWKTYSRNTKVELKTLSHFKTQIALGITYIENNQKGITLGTVHSVKGLEYPIVFVIGMTQGAFPDFRAIQKGGNELESEENAFYVAVTRAERFLYLTYPKNRETQYGMKTQKESEFIEKLLDI
ncbi:ATP-dependent helicase [Flavobacterium muglaense]|uniref:DNA 3'-5' helicase n=1 Tax=Flavobacterium muglaense TaxID=2764716 RepID=A0A923SDZ6_9FLAO|nr:ATP-dependent helicase [Flavobacterium muglaense]MBC5836421.1 ATP-dependent helicase [Flavobacterium muglaense]MBC5842951.1 ATP-dependent helicase [Flavobacterium muglaense]